jgi:hypothetical protein
MSIDARLSNKPKVVAISAETSFENFDSLVVVDAGSDGFKVEDSDGVSSSWPSGVPLTINKKEGVASKITITDPATGTLNATAIIYY